MVTVTLTSEAREQLAELPRTIALRGEKLWTRLSRWPDVSGVKHLRGDHAGKCRLRTGDYRVQFFVRETKKAARKGNGGEPVDHVVVVEKIGHRDGFYED